MAYRVVQWTTGNVGRQSVEAIVAHPDLELVGCYAWSPDKAGRDVGELCGIAPTGVLATNDVDALLALNADCVVYNPMWADVDEMVRMLEAGSNVVSTAAFITGHSFGDGRRRIIEACERGGTSVFGSGINPGFADLIAIVSASGCDRIDKITVTETADSTGYDSPATELPVGFARPDRRPGPPTDDRVGDGRVRRRRPPDRRRARRRVRRGGLRGGVRGDDRGPGPRLVAHTRRVRRRRRRQLARQSRRPQHRRAPGQVAQGPVPRAELGDGLRVPHRDRGSADDPDQGRYLAAARLPSHDLRRVHGPRDDPDRHAGGERHSQRGRGAARDRDLHRHPPPPAERPRIRACPATPASGRPCIST